MLKKLLVPVLIVLSLDASAAVVKKTGPPTPLPGNSPVTALLQSMSIGQVVELTNGTTSFFNANVNLGTAFFNCANFDGSKTIPGHEGDYCTGTGVSPFNGDSSVQSKLQIGGGSLDSWPYSSAPCGYGSAGVFCIFSGGGHYEATGGADSTIYGFDVNAAATAKLHSQTAPNWFVAHPPARYVWGDASVKPSWSAEYLNPSCGGAQGWYTTTAQDTNNTGSVTYAGAGSAHTGMSQVFIGTNAQGHPLFLAGTGYVVADLCSSGGGSGNVTNDTLIVDPLAKTGVLATGGSGGGSFFLYLGSSWGGDCYSPSDGNVYSANPDFSFRRFNSPQTGRNPTNIGGNIYSYGVLGIPDICIPDPTNPSQTMYVSLELMVGTNPNEVGTNITRAPQGHTYKSWAAFSPTLVTGSYRGLDWDSDDGYIVLADGSGHLYPVNLHGSNVASNWSVDNDPLPLSGDAACEHLYDTSGHAADFFLRVTYLPKSFIGNGMSAALITGSTYVCLKRMH